MEENETVEHAVGAIKALAAEIGMLVARGAICMNNAKRAFYALKYLRAELQPDEYTEEFIDRAKEDDDDNV